MNIDSRLDDLHHSDHDENGVKGKWYCGQGEGWTFYPEGTPEITLGNESMLTISEAAKQSLGILGNKLDVSRLFRKDVKRSGVHIVVRKKKSG